MFRKLKHLYYSYAIYDLPTDFLLAIRTKQVRAWFRNGLNCTAGMSAGWKGKEKFLASMKMEKLPE